MFPNKIGAEGPATSLPPRSGPPGTVADTGWDRSEAASRFFSSTQSATASLTVGALVRGPTSKTFCTTNVSVASLTPVDQMGKQPVARQIGPIVDLDKTSEAFPRRLARLLSGAAIRQHRTHPPHSSSSSCWPETLMPRRCRPAALLGISSSRSSSSS